jgi:hypothetical protein
MRKIFEPMVWIVLLGLMMATLPVLAEDQDTFKRSGFEVRVTGGSLYIEDDMPASTIVGGSVRYYLGQRIALEMEFLYSSNIHRNILVGFPTVLYHLTSPKKGESYYVFAGIGLERCWTKESGHRSYWSLWPSAGLGVKFGKKISLSLEVRFVGFAASVGYAFKQ